MARLIVAKSGYDISADKKYLSIDSDYSNLMIIEEKDFAGTVTEYSHGLGYLPVTLEYFRYSTKWFPMDSPVYDTSGVDTMNYPPIIEYDNTKIYIDNYDELPVKIFIAGNSADNQTGSGKNTASGRLKITKSGLDAESVTDVRQFQFCSGLDLIKKDIEGSGQTTVAKGIGFAKSEITHNLGYVPIVTARLVSNPYDSAYNGIGLPLNVADLDYAPVSFYITSTKIVFFVDGSASDGNYVISYNLYRNKIA